jgi:hypothetical protein
MNADLTARRRVALRGAQMTPSKILELENSLMKPLTTPIIVALAVAVVVIGYLYYQRTRNDITIQMAKVEMKR